MVGRHYIARQQDYSQRDKDGLVAFYVPLWKRNGITLEQYDEYWKNVHGPVCSRLPGQFQYWQWHVAHNDGGMWPGIEGVSTSCTEDEQFEGIAELTFKSEEDRNIWFKAAAILMDDEHNIFRKAIGYNSAPGNSKTFADAIRNGAPNGTTAPLVKYHVLLRKNRSASVADFRKFMFEEFAPAMMACRFVLKLRVHLFEEIDNSRPDAPGVSHNEPEENQYHGAFEIAFLNGLDYAGLFYCDEYFNAVKNLGKYVRQMHPFRERTGHAFVYDGRMTLAGLRGARVAEMITEIGAMNQLSIPVINLMLRGELGIEDGK
ncbi:MAG: EthD domain-containing protein [Candidatus Magnetoovum sp. WYHC-5]|nr:EthD domain-containing protein [Candidatus Magnetoovum sp. WYHC-5]